MEILGFRTVDSLPALYQEEMDMLAVADLHLGLEKTMTFRGNYVPRHQLDQIKSDLEKAEDETGASRILVNGDLKNEFRTSHAEKKEIEELLEFLEEKFSDIIVIEGNHDTLTGEIETGASFKEYHVEKGILFFHGDRGITDIEPEQEFETIVIGHEHPALALEDEIGVREKVDCFLYGETLEKEKIIVLPAFSSISNGTSINETPIDELLSPVLRNRTEPGKLKAVGVSREAGILEFSQVEDLTH